MKKVVLVFGLIAGVLVSIFGFTIMALCNSDVINFDNGDYFGYTAIVIALSMVFFGVKSYRDNYQKGSIKFGKALLVGLLISLFASVVWASISEVYYQISPDMNDRFLDKYSVYLSEKMKASGSAQTEIDAKVKEIEAERVKYNSPIYRFLMTVAILFPVGIIVALISAAILRKKEVFPV